MGKATSTVMNNVTSHAICVGCDLHDKNMLLMIGIDDRPPVKGCDKIFWRYRKNLLSSLS